LVIWQSPQHAVRLAGPRQQISGLHTGVASSSASFAVEAHDLEGIVAKRKSDPYSRGGRLWKVKNRAYSQAEGRLFNGDGRSLREGKRALIRVARADRVEGRASA
jgi:hypothetical protein